jgi:hypothetical protein
MAVDLNPIPGYNKDGEDSVWAFRNSQSGVKQLLAGSGITLSPASGLGAVTVTSSGGGGSGTVTSVTAGSSNIVIGGTPTVAPTVDLSANPSVTSLTSSGLTLNPGASTLSPFTLSGRNYLDINAPTALIGVPGALRLTGNTGNITLDDNIAINAAAAQFVTFNGGSGQQMQFDPNKNVTIKGGVVTTSLTEGLVTIKIQTSSNTGLFLTAPFGDPVIGKAILDGYDCNVGSNQGGTNRYLNYAHLVEGSSWAFKTPTIYRVLSGSDIVQPVIQYGTATGSGATGTVVVTIPTAYTSATSYVVQVTMQDSPTAQLYATPTLANEFKIGWTSAGVGTQNIMWTTFGT